ncbi:hypothetical protein [Nonomuraea sp. NPDC003804]
MRNITVQEPSWNLNENEQAGRHDSADAVEAAEVSYGYARI